MHPRSRLRKRSIVDFKYKNRPRTKKDKPSLQTTVKKLFRNKRRKLLYIFLIFIIIMLLVPLATYLYFANDLKDKNSVMNRQQTGLTLMDRDGQVFYTFDLAKSFTYIPITDIPKTAQ